MKKDIMNWFCDSCQIEGLNCRIQPCAIKDELSKKIDDMLDTAPRDYTAVKGGYNTGWNDMCQNVDKWIKEQKGIL